jgi:hypothetical protein
MKVLGVWIAAFFTIAAYSFLFDGNNPLFQFAEHVFIGVASAQATVMAYDSLIARAWKPIANGQWMMLWAVIGGFMLWFRFVRQTQWISRIPLGFLMGVTAALSVTRSVNAEFWRQVAATASLNWSKPNDAIYIVLVLSTLSYFLFCYREQSAQGRFISRTRLIGQYVMMISFGATLGNTVMARLSLVIGRIQFLLGDWLHIMK